MQLMQNNVHYIESREVSKMVEKRHDHLVRDIDSYIAAMLEMPQLQETPDLGSHKMKNSVPFIAEFFIESSYQIPGQHKSYKCYLCTRKGCEMIANKMIGEKGVRFTARYINRFHEMEMELAIPSLDKFSPQLQVLINLEIKQREQEAMINSLSGEIEGIRKVVALNPASDWRRETNALVSRIADARGGQSYCRAIRTEIYNLFEQRYQVNLNVRLRHKIERLKKEGVSNSKANMLNKLDVIGEEEKLINGYIATVKEVAIKYGAA